MVDDPNSPDDLECDLRLDRQKRLERRVQVTRTLSPYRPISDTERAHIVETLKRTGIRYKTLISLIPSSFSDITMQIVKGWVNGTTKTARPEHIECVTSILAGLPDAADTQSPFSQAALDASHNARVNPSPVPAKPKKTATVIEPEPITKDRKLVLADPAIVMPRKSDLQGPRVFPNLSNERLPRKPKWKSSPTTSPQVLAYPDIYRMIDEETFDCLHAEVQRTRVSPSLMIKRFKSAPPSLPARRISEWMRLVTRSGEIKLIEWVLRAYAILPDAH